MMSGVKTLNNNEFIDLQLTQLTIPTVLPYNTSLIEKSCLSACPDARGSFQFKTVKSNK